MNFYWVYDIPNWLFCCLTIAMCVVFSGGGMLLTRRPARRIFGADGMNDVVSYFLSATGVFYGITLGLIAVGAWQNFTTVSDKVSQEAAAFATVCQDVSVLPDSPAKTKLNEALKEYTRYTIDVAWPIQRTGQIPKGGTGRIMDIHRMILALKINTETDKIVVAELNSRLNTVIEWRRLRLEAVTSGIPGLLYWVVLIGGFINVSITWCFVTKRAAAHVLLCGAIGALIGLLVFMVAAMDNPFRGEYCVGPDAFEIVFERFFGT